MTDAQSLPAEVSMQEVEAEGVVSLPNKEVLSLLDVNANVDLGLDLAAPVDLAAAANLNVAAPIEAAASANVLSPDATAIGVAQQHGTIDQSLSGSADATAPQHATIDQTTGTGTAGSGTAGTADTGAATAEPAATTGGTDLGGVGSHLVDGGPATAGADVGSTAGEVGNAVGSTVGDATSGAGSTVGDVGNTLGDATSGTTGGVDSLLNGGSLLDANVNVHANADLTAPIDGAVAANGNVAAPVDAAVGANIGSPGATAEALAPQQVDIEQNLDHVSADATATQDAGVTQQ